MSTGEKSSRSTRLRSVRHCQIPNAGGHSLGSDHDTSVPHKYNFMGNKPIIHAKFLGPNVTIPIRELHADARRRTRRRFRQCVRGLGSDRAGSKQAFRGFDPRREFLLSYPVRQGSSAQEKRAVPRARSSNSCGGSVRQGLR
jgi:hypothetical protein